MGRVAFIMLLVFSLPIGFHHLFMDPFQAAGWKFLHMTGTFMVAVPTLITGFTIIASLEIAGRLRGGKGLFGWISALPWGNPMVTAAILAMLMLTFGGFGGMISFEINGGEEAVRAFIEHLQYFSLAESLGGVESLVCHPPSMTHAPVSEEALGEAGISQSLVRLSIGLEAVEDLVDDVLKALDAAKDALAPEPVAVCG